MRPGQLITGIVMLLIGIGFSIIPFFLINLFFFWIYGIPILIIGIIILLNRDEDKIENVSFEKKKRK